MYDDNYGMCCSEEMANECAKDYADWVTREDRKGTIEFIIIMGIIIGAAIFLTCTIGL